MKYTMMYMKADFEPWWQFDGWQEYIIEQWSFDSERELEKALSVKIAEMRAKYPCERKNKERFYAFWDEQETEYCEGCDEDTQIYHGIITEIKELEEVL